MRHFNGNVTEDTIRLIGGISMVTVNVMLSLLNQKIVISHLVKSHKFCESCPLILIFTLFLLRQWKNFMAQAWLW